jgi:hypothetical protein
MQRRQDRRRQNTEQQSAEQQGQGDGDQRHPQAKTWPALVGWIEEHGCGDFRAGSLALAAARRMRAETCRDYSPVGPMEMRFAHDPRWPVESSRYGSRKRCARASPGCRIESGR